MSDQDYAVRGSAGYDTPQLVPVTECSPPPGLMSAKTRSSHYPHASEFPLPYEYGFEILRSEVGSTLHGTAIEGQDDRDWMGMCVEPRWFITGLDHFEQWQFRTAAVREGKQDAKSQPGDTDLTVYSLRKWMRLALKGNPTVLLPLFAANDRLVFSTSLGGQLRKYGPDRIISKQAGPAFLGYLRAQRDRFAGLTRTHIPKRPQLIEAHGYDTKFAMHAIRLGLQGIELMRTGRMSAPMVGDALAECRAVRRGEISKDAAAARMDALERELALAIQQSNIRSEPDRVWANDFLHGAYDWYWR